jgi:hypothetical protein
MGTPGFDRLYRWQERVSREWGNPLSLALDRLSRRHVTVGPLLQATSLFVLAFFVFWALLDFSHSLAAAIFSGAGAISLLLFNLGYYRWLNSKQQMHAGTAE